MPGRLFPVEVFYTAEPERDYVAAAVKTAVQIHLYEPPGDILLFLTGEQEILDACTALRREAASFPAGKPPLLAVPLYASLPPAQQAEAFEPASAGCRKVVVATNIAETSVTIDGVVYVVDCGFCKQKVFDPKTRVEAAGRHARVAGLRQAARRSCRSNAAGQVLPPVHGAILQHAAAGGCSHGA